MGKPPVPDVLWGPWTPQHTKDLYYNPETGKAEDVLLSVELPDEELAQQMALRQKLMKYHFAKATRFVHEDPKVPGGCVVIRMGSLEEPPTIIRWGLSSDDEMLWARAVYYDGEWRHLESHETINFAYDLSDDETYLEGVYLLINDVIVAEF